MRVSCRQSKIILKSINNIEELKVVSNEATPFYQNAATLPPFLANNLKAQHRVVKQFNDEHALLKAFYFSLMKLAFQIENQEIDYVQICKDIMVGEQEFCEGDLEDKDLSDQQYRLFLSQFFDNLENQQVPCFETTIKKYPIVDRLLLNIFRKLVPLSLVVPDDSDNNVAKRVFEYLCQRFQIKIQIISGCFKFVESDIFVYIDTMKHVYLIFIDQLHDIRELSEEEVTSQGSMSTTSLSQKEKTSNVVIQQAKLSQNNISHIEPSKNRKSNKVSKQIDDQSNLTTVINMLESKRAILSGTDSSEPSSGSKRQSKISSVKQDQKQIRTEYYSDKNSQKRQEKTKYTPKNEDLYCLNSNKNSTKGEAAPKKSILLSNKSELSSRNGKQCRFSAKSSQLDIFPICNSNVKQQNKYKLPTQQFAGKRTSTFSNSPFKLLTFDSVSFRSLDQQEHLHDDKFRRKSQFSTNTCTKPTIHQRNSKVYQPTPLKQFNSNKDHDDSGYEKFTDSGLLNLIDDEYRLQIRKIKNEYRQKRANIRHIF